MRYIVTLAAALALAVVAAPAEAKIPLLSGSFGIPDEWYDQPNNDGAYSPWWIDKWDVEGEMDISPCDGHEVCGDHGEGDFIIGGPLVIVFGSGLVYLYFDANVYYIPAEGDSSSNHEFCASVADEWNYDRCLTNSEEYGG